MVNHRKKSVSRLSALWTLPCPLMLNGHSVASGGPFVLEKAVYTCSHLLQEGIHSLPVWPSECPYPGVLHKLYRLLSLPLSPSLLDFFPWSTMTFLSLNSHFWNLHLPHSLFPIVHIHFLIFGLISSLFKVIWCWSSCVWGMRQAWGPLLFHHLNSSLPR